MKKLLYIFVLFCTTHFFAQSYNFKVSGNIQSEKEKTAIESATIHLERLKDSSVVSYTISDAKGNFNLEGKSFYKDVKMVVSFVGMQPFEKNIPLDKKSVYNLGTINLKEDNGNVLDEVVIRSRAPITVKKDTLEFNVKSFKTKKDANVEDLLKKLPGVEVDEQGKITVNGKPVNKILVNGKPFFGNDPTITTKNLTKEIIEKVQITTTKTKSESFTGEKGDTDNKTINLTIKKENNKGWFGRLSAGAGTNKRYEGAGMINRFNNDTRVSVLFGGNNINSPGFSFGEIQKMFGSGGSMSYSSNGSFSINGRRFGGGQGLVKSRTAGATYSDVYGKDIDVNMNYFHSGSTAENTTRVERENFYANRPKFFSNSRDTSINENDNHSINGEIDIKIDSTFLINISPSFMLNKRDEFSKNFQESLNENNVLTNKYNATNTGKSDDKRFENKLDFTKKFSRKGSFLKLSIDNIANKAKSDEYNNSSTEFFGANANTETRNQFIDSDSDYNRFGSKITYRHAIIPDTLFFDVKYGFINSKRENVRNTFDFNTVTQQFSNFNTNLSSDFEYENTRQTPAIQLTYRKKKWRTSIETAYVFRTMENQDKLRPEFNLKRNFKALELDVDFSYRFDNKASIYSGYNLRNAPPEIRQLQAFADEKNPLNITVGNPNLKPTSNHNLYINYNKFNWQKRTGIFAYVGIDAQQDKVAPKSTLDAKLVRRTTYENVNGNYGLNGSISYSKRFSLDSLSTLRLRVGTWSNIRRNVFFVNGEKLTSNRRSFSPNIGLTYNWNKAIEIAPNYSVSFSRTTYDASNSLENQNFTTHRLGIRTKTTVPKRLEWRNDIRYNYNPQIADGFNKSAWFWNSTLSYSMFKDQGTLSLKAYDLLKQNNNSKRIASTNFIEDRESTVLEQYFMLSFSWKFNSLGKKGKVRDFDFHI